MKSTIHTLVAQMIERAVALMDDFMRERIDLDTYATKLNSLDANGILEKYQDDFKKDRSLVYCLDALMMLSSLQHELDFQVAEYGANVTSEDIRMLKDILVKLSHDGPH